MVFRPATPGFIVTLAATICLAVVVFSVPWLKSIYFLQGHIHNGGINGTITLGVLGYCLNTGGGDVCSKPSIGYEFDPNAVLGIDKIKIPAVVVKWITYTLVLHVVALVFAAGSSLFGLLAHVREMSMICCSNCFSGFAASMALIAFIFDIVFFFIVRSRITAVGGTASIGTGVWLTLAAWVMLFFASCFYSFGQCCLRNRPRVPGQPAASTGTNDRYTPPFIGKSDSSSEQLRLDAVKAEADRKQRQRIGEGGLPAFQEYESKPLRTQFIEEEEEDPQPYRDRVDQRRQPSTGTVATTGTAVAGTGYAPAPRGTTAMDEYYSPSQQPRQPQGAAYPPPARQWQQTPAHVQIASHYPEIVEPQVAPTSTPAVGHALFASNYGPQAGYGSHQQYLSTATGTHEYGHEARGTSYHSAHSHFPSTYSQPEYPTIPNPYDQGAPPSLGSYQPAAASSFPQASYLQPGSQVRQPSHADSYYNANVSTPAGYNVTSPAMPRPSVQHRDSDSSYYSNLSAQQMPPQPQSATSLPYALTPGRVATSTPNFASQQQAGAPAPPRGPRSPTSPTSPTSPGGRRQSMYQNAPTDMPPSYDAGPSAGSLQPEKS